jgi:RNA polymerase sigma-70 factor (ECF subfamily)
MRVDEFERLYQEHAPGLLGFLVYRTGDRALAEDVLADAFERVLRSRRRFDPRRGAAKTWVYSIAINRLRDQLRRRDAERRAIEGVAGRLEESSTDLASVEDRSTVMEALAQLGEAEREALALRYGADLTLPEIARVSGEKLTTVEGRVYRGLDKLRALLEESGGGRTLSEPRRRRGPEDGTPRPAR